MILSPIKYNSCREYISTLIFTAKIYKFSIDYIGLDGVVNLMADSELNKIQRKTDREIAREVIDGKWGTSSTKPTRKELLTLAGYDYNKVQAIVNQLCGR